jgi:CHAT domain-containing protein
MRSGRVFLNRAAAIALILSLAGLFPVPEQAQQPSNAVRQEPTPPAQQGAAKSDTTRQQPPNPTPQNIADAREALRKADANHPGNTPEVLKALNDLIMLIIDAGAADAETLALVNRELQATEAVEGPRSKNYVGVLGVQADILLGLNRAPDARPVAEHALEIAEKEFPDALEAGTAAGVLGRICSNLADYACALRAHTVAVDVARKTGGNNSFELMAALNNLGAMKGRMGDIPGAIKAQEEALAIAYRINPADNHNGVIENNLGANYVKVQQFDKAAEHLHRAVEMVTKVYGPNSQRVMQVNRNLAKLYSGTGQFDLAWKAFDFSQQNKYEQVDAQALSRALFAQSLAQGGAAARAVDEGLTSARMSRELFVLQARTLPERQALDYDASRPHGMDTAISVQLKHPELPVDGIFQEVARSRALVADEMARRQKNLNTSNDPETARLLKELDQARSDLLKAERSTSQKTEIAQAIGDGTTRMEKIERSLAERSAAIRSDERISQVTLSDLRQNLPRRSVLVSFVLFQRSAVDRLDPANAVLPSYAAFVLHPDSDRIRVFDLGEARPIDDLVAQARAAADAEAHGGGLGSMRNERNYRAAGEALRRLVWDPLKPELGDARMAFVVPDGLLNLIPFASFPEGKGYLVEHGPVIHILTSERDLVPAESGPKKSGLLALGSPQFELTAGALPPAPLRDASVPCEAFRNLEFQPLPGTGVEVSDLVSAWRRWNGSEPSVLLTGAEATEGRFIEAASQTRMLHVATHAFLLDKSCGNGNPLLHSGLVFAGANQSRDAAILTAQQIASLDLSGVDWAVLSACNTGNGELRDGEGVLGLERAFRVAGARSVVMTLWPVDDQVTRQFMHELYTERLQHHATTADAVWGSARKLLLARRAAGKSTHPWYWAGFVGSGGWE